MPEVGSDYLRKLEELKIAAVRWVKAMKAQERMNAQDHTPVRSVMVNYGYDPETMTQTQAMEFADKVTCERDHIRGELNTSVNVLRDATERFSRS